ncbi:MAG: iron ABC transporter permease [Candidatus Hydrogenedentes bacterium]|nr:iron ABC transporter permease [Candidatus Hydrogenedentota bacterium]
MKSRAVAILLCAIVCAALVLASIAIGTESIDLRDAFTQWRSGADLAGARELNIVLTLRLPRTLLALLAGAGLALAGCAFQALLRNPLATPYTLGIDSFAALGAYTATVLGAGTAMNVLGYSLVQVAAFAAATLDVLIIYAMATRARRMSPLVLLLAGVTLGLLANSGILFLRYLAKPEQLINMDRWLMGGVDLIGYEPVWTLLIGIVPCALVLLAQAARFDQLGFGEDLAAGRGVDVRRLQVTTFLVCSIMTGVIVSKVGPIGFVGLVVPHAVRTITGSRHRVLMPMSMVAGGAFLCLCDIIARKAMTGETPIGIITSIVGAPFFLYLLVRRRFADWDSQ